MLIELAYSNPPEYIKATDRLVSATLEYLGVRLQMRAVEMSLAITKKPEDTEKLLKEFTKAVEMQIKEAYEIMTEFRTGEKLPF